MKTFKKIIAVFLCLLTIIGGFSFAASAEETTSENWVELRYNDDLSTISFNVPYNVISESVLFPTRIMVKTDGKPIEDCFTVTPEEYEDIAAVYLMHTEYLGICLYDEEDDCYYAQFKVVDTDWVTIREKYGPQDIIKCILATPLLQIAKVVEFKINPKPYKYAHEKGLT